MSLFRPLLVALSLALFACAADDPGPELAVGFAISDTSPTTAQIATKKLYMGAYGPPFVRWAEGIHDAVKARAMAVESGHEGLILIALDAPVISEHFLRDVEQGVAAGTGLPSTRVAVGVTHSHSTPDLMGLWGGIPADYRKRVLERVVKAGVNAWNARVDATLEAATGKAKNRNRRGWGFTDDELTVLHARDLTGSSLGTLVNFAAHPIFFDYDNKKISRDFCGYLVDALDKQLGGTALYFNGAEGDVSPDFDGGSAEAKAKGYGEAMAAEAVAALKGAVEVRQGLVVQRTTWELLVSNAYFSLAERGGLLSEFDVEKRAGKLVVTVGSTYFRLGTAIQGVTFPGESLTRNGLAIKKAMKTKQRLLLGLTSGSLGYFVPGDEWKSKGSGYEETISASPEAGDQARDTIKAMIEKDAF